MLGASQASADILPDQVTPSLSLAGRIAILEDPNQAFTLAQVAGPELSAGFRPAADANLNFGYTQSAYWIRLRLPQGSANQPDAILEISYFSLRSVTLFGPDGQVWRTGQYQPPNQRPIDSRFFAFPIKLDPHQEQDYYLRVASAGSLTIPLRLWSSKDVFHAQSERSISLQALYFGEIASLFLFNLLLWLMLRERLRAYYLAWLFSIGMAMLSISGLGRYFLWPDGVNWDLVVSDVAFAVAMFFAMQFARTFLDTRNRLPKLDRLLRVLLLMLFTLALMPLIEMGFVGERLGLVAPLLSGIGVLASALISGVTLSAVIRRQQGAMLFALVWGLLIASGIIHSARNLDWIPTNVWTFHALWIGSGLEMLLLAFALVARIRAETLARQKAQSQALEAERTRLEAAREQERRLEQTVASRTQSLREALAGERRALAQQRSFGSLLAHEFRSPLGAIQAHAELLLLDRAQQNTLLGDSLKRIRHAAGRIGHLVDAWLLTDRLQRSDFEVRRQILSLDSWMPGVIAETGCGHQRVDCALPALRVCADPELLRLVLYNLIDNACKYSGEDAPIQVGVTTEACQLLIWVQDQGPGIPAGERELIFERAYRGAEQTQAGLGLGLFTAREIVRLHDGTLTLENPADGGCRFEIRLPLSHCG